MSDSLLLLCTAEDPTFLSVREIDAAALLRDVAARWQAASRRPVGVDVAGALTVLADEERIRCALDALIENALQATESAGKVTLGLRSEGAAVVLEVRDSGPGVPAWAREKVFDRFYSVDVTSARRGSGLGLPVVRAIAEAHGGSLSLDSTPGQTVFSLRLPSAAAASPEARHVDRLAVSTDGAF
jgi:signal transduction histidine kinase